MMVTIIIPELIEGERYIARVRVAAPWISEPASVTFTAGRLAYCVNEDGADSALYLFSTGNAENAIAPTIKKIILPTGNANPAGVAIRDGKAYIFDITDLDIYVLDIESAVHNARAPAERTFSIPSGVTVSYFDTRRDYMDILGDRIYLRNSTNRIITFDVDTADGQTATLINTGNYSLSSNTSGTGLSVLYELIFIVLQNVLRIFPRDDDGTSATRIKQIQGIGEFQWLGIICILLGLMVVIAGSMC